MNELRDLQKLRETATSNIDQYAGHDFILPQAFKDQVKFLKEGTVIYEKYSAIITNKSNLKVYLPNQWFYIASYLTDLYHELHKYKAYAVTFISNERLKDGVTELTTVDKVALNNLDITLESKEYLEKFIIDSAWWGGGKTIDRGDFHASPLLNAARLVNATSTYIVNLCEFLADKKELVDLIINAEENKQNQNKIACSLQQIFYGAPGTGKSHTIKTLTGVDCTNVIRTTFHPDSDYSTFVGAYKPTMEETGIQIRDRKEKKITYTFVPQAFLQAYVKAWTQDEPVYLIIEEINRGNCAQIFGDIFQLLDRNDEGYSDYVIHNDKDIENHLKEELKDSPREDILEDVRKGKIMLLPNNLYIWATMNTSDQSLFPIDSAFKRRWDWVYVPISDAGKGWTIKIGNNQYDWWEFVRRMNAEIEILTSSQDKKLGYFFAKAKDNVIDEKRFVGKVLFYLWNDVFKDYDVNEDLIKDTDGKLEFWKFYLPDSKVNIEKVQRFLSNLGMTIKMTKDEEIEEERIAQEIADEEKAGRDYTRYAINGEGNYRKKALGSEVLKLFILKSASNLNGNLNCSKELEHYSS